MENKNKLILTGILSVFGSGLSDVALLTAAFMITKSPEKTSYIVSLRLLSSLLVFFLMPKLLNFLSMRFFSMATDLIRAVSCFLVIFTWNIYLLALFSVVISFCTGVNIALKNVAFQTFVNSNQRLEFISKQQFFYNSFGLSAPVVSSLIINLYSIKLVFLLDGILFLTSAMIVCRLDEWDAGISRKWKGIFSGFIYILQEKIQRNILYFRLSIITSMVAYEIISTYILTSDYREIAGSVNIFFLKSYSDLIALFSFMGTVSLLIGSFFQEKYSKWRQ